VPVCFDIKRGICRQTACKNAPTVANTPRVPPPPLPTESAPPVPAQPFLSAPPSCAYVQATPVTAFRAAAAPPQAYAAGGMHVNFTGNISGTARVEFVSNVNIYA